jgi:hypothetical protein
MGRHERAVFLAYSITIVTPNVATCQKAQCENAVPIRAQIYTLSYLVSAVSWARLISTGFCLLN